MRDLRDAFAGGGWGGWSRARRARAGEPDASERLDERDSAGRGWDLYLVAAAVLAPIVVPAGPVNTTILDAVNAVALTLFFTAVARRQIAVRFLFVVPMLVILVQSLLAVTNAISVSASVASLAKD